MVKILHLSDLHFVNNAAAYNTKEILLREAKEQVKNVPQGQKLLIITGDLHNFWEADYAPAEKFIHDLVSVMHIDMKQDVFIVPGNHDVGNDSTLQPLLSKDDPDWKKHDKSSITMLRSGDISYIPERLRAFRPYSVLAQHLGIYDPALGDDYPAQTHLRNWRGKLNILHLNTALIADGISKRDQMTDTDAAANPDTWKSFDTEHIPAIAIAHNNFYGMERKQRMELAASFLLYNVSAYLFGERHQMEKEPEYQMIRLTSGYMRDEEIQIPNLVPHRGFANRNDVYSEVGICWHEWDEETERVNARFVILNPVACEASNSGNGDVIYTMRRNKKIIPETSPVPDTDLKDYLYSILYHFRDNHPSFLSLKKDTIDERLFPGVKNTEQFVSLGKTTENGNVSPVWNIIRESWKNDEKRNIVIEGTGGIGKTTALFSILDQSNKDLPPAIYVPMYRLVTPKEQCVYLSDYFQEMFPAYSNRINELASMPWNRGPQLLVLLDSFDEVPSAKRHEMLHILNEWSLIHPGAQLIVASRPMDLVHLGTELADAPITIILEPLSRDVVREYLGARTPPEESPLWNVLTLPLFLNLYQRSEKLERITSDAYPLALKKTKGEGTLIWNLLQWELLRENGEERVLCCAFACEYILPCIAYRMEQKNLFIVETKLILKWIEEARAALNLENLPHHLSVFLNEYKKRHFTLPDLSAIDWKNIVLYDVGLLTRNEYGYSFIHQNYRDALAGLYLVNQAEMMKEEDALPEVW